MNKIAVVDYGMGNLRSVCKALEHAGSSVEVCLTSSPHQIREADRVVFPGQGAIRGCVAALEARGLRDALLESMKTKPFLGICLGLQALYDFSEEGGGTETLRVLPGKVRLFPKTSMQDRSTARALKVPHMGWNQVHQVVAHPLWRGIVQDSRFYFVHSYYVESDDEGYVVGTSDYGIRFTSAAAKENLFALQCHPEKSQQVGLRLLRNFCDWNGEW